MLTDHLLLLEHKACVEQLPKEIVVQPSLRTFKEWQVFMFLPSGPYSGKIISFSIHFEKYPQQIPDVIFQSGFVHPLIDPNSNSFKSQILFGDWNRYSRVHDLISQIYHSFLEIPTVKQPVNPSAETLLNNKSMFAQVLKQITTIDPNESEEQNTPKKWTSQKEKLCKALYPSTVSK